MAHQLLPRSGPAREALRERGQFWTPAWVAEAMVTYVLSDGAKTLFDPALGEGAFVEAALRVARKTRRPIAITGCELDERIVNEVLAKRFHNDVSVECRDFILNPPLQSKEAIVANPPYIRHHRLSDTYKAHVKAMAKLTIGQALDGRAGVHVYFLIRALTLLAPGGRLAFILPADVFEGVFAKPLWRWIASCYRLDAVMTFSPEATPFPGVDTNAVVVMLSKQAPSTSYTWARCNVPGTTQFAEWAAGSGRVGQFTDLVIETRDLSVGLEDGLARAASPYRQVDCVPLGMFARALRGIATGANEFFFMTKTRAQELGIPLEFFVRAVGRTRDVSSAELTVRDLDELDVAGRPTYLLSLDRRSVNAFPAPVRKYLAYGESLGLPDRPLIASRRPWYKMERREVPPLLFAYLGRRNCRFIRNFAGAVPLTGFLCVYPLRSDERSIQSLWEALNELDIEAALSAVGKTYGGGAVKVEPRALERVPLPRSLVRRVGLLSHEPSVQLELA